jgi:signal peptidase
LVDDAPTEADKQHPGRVVWRMIGAGLTAGVLALILILAALAVVVPAVTGSQSYNITTDSMRPSYPPGTLVIVKPVDSEDIRIGDVITYQVRPGSPTVITHRVKGTTLSTNGSRSFITMGDNNAIADTEPVVEEQIRGRLWYVVPWIGFLSSARQNSVLGIAIPVIGFGLILYSGYLVISWLRDLMRGRSRR